MLLASGGITGNPYKIVYVLHLLVVIIGIGGVLLNGVYGIAAKNAGGPAGVAILKANSKATGVAMKFIYLIPVFGYGLVFMSDEVYTPEQTWVWLSFALYV